MGGPVPLGYDVENRKLVVNETEAELVRHIMRRYLELDSVTVLGSGLIDQSQKMTVAARTMAEKKAVAQRS